MMSLIVFWDILHVRIKGELRFLLNIRQFEIYLLNYTPLQKIFSKFLYFLFLFLFFFFVFEKKQRKIQ